MSFIYRDRKDDEFDYGSTFCPFRDGCSAHNCFNCRVVRSSSSVRKDDADLENHFASGL